MRHRRLHDQTHEFQNIAGISYAEYPFLCGVVGSSSVELALRNMPHLSSVRLSVNPDVIHGISWKDFTMFLSLPNLQKFSMSGLLFCPVKSPSDIYDPQLLPPLVSFCYGFSLFRHCIYRREFEPLDYERQYSFTTEEDLLSLALEKLHHSLETLVLPSESAPIRSISSWYWPNLRELRFRGERLSKFSTPLVTLFSRMPRLRILVIELVLMAAEDDDRISTPIPLWPKGLVTSFPWPDLEHLAISHPHLEDEIYSHLPSSINTLSLCCAPHKSEQDWSTKRLGRAARYRYPVMDSAAILTLLSRCRTPHLKHLEIEYETGDRESDLLHQLLVSYPRLISLQIHRYRSSDECISVVSSHYFCRRMR